MGCTAWLNIPDQKMNPFVAVWVSSQYNKIVQLSKVLFSIK